MIYACDIDMNINKTKSKRKYWVSRRTPYNFLWMKVYCIIAVRIFIIIILDGCLHKIKQEKS